eukprot:TRINITY_DN374_c0_g1_i1.p1 TRINITY_DN374_c0_g1~~TRINITY_DN374_c0_g1_i1.p1  ORF type:complete len:488 (-),score=83.65 TRINITY_DN374_c0_g1_i1:414-1877(-)
MKRKEPDPHQAGHFTIEDATAEQRHLATTQRASKRPKLQENETNSTDPVPPAILERFADAGRRHLRVLMQRGGWEGDEAVDQVLSRLTESSISDKTPPPYTTADVKLVRKLTGFDFPLAERVLRLREEICLLSNQLKIEPAEAVDTLTSRLVSEFDVNYRKRHRDDTQTLEIDLERPPKRSRDSEDSRPGKRSHTDLMESNPNPKQDAASSNASLGPQNTPDLAGPQKRRKITESSSSSSQTTNLMPQDALQALASAVPTSSSNSGLPAISEGFISRFSNAVKQSILNGAARLAILSPGSAPGPQQAAPKPETFAGSSSIFSSAPTLPPNFTYSPDSPVHSTESPASASPASGSGGDSPFHASPFISLGFSNSLFGSGFGASPSGVPASPFGSTTRSRSRARESYQNDPFDDASSLHSDDRSTTSSMMVHPSHSVDGNADDNIADDASSCASNSSVPSRKSRGGGNGGGGGGGGDDSSPGAGSSFRI